MVSSKHQSALRNSLTFNLFTPFKNFFVQPSIVNPFPSLSLLDHPSSSQGFIYSIIYHPLSWVSLLEWPSDEPTASHSISLYPKKSAKPASNQNPLRAPANSSVTGIDFESLPCCRALSKAAWWPRGPDSEKRKTLQNRGWEMP